MTYDLITAGLNQLEYLYVLKPVSRLYSGKKQLVRRSKDINRKQQYGGGVRAHSGDRIVQQDGR